MGFTPFIDDLAMIEVFLLLVASVLAYSGLRVWWAARTHRPDNLRSVLRGTGVPLGLVGGATLAIALWGEMTWPFLTSDGMGGYNIFFFDPLVFMGFVLVAFAVAAVLSLKLQYVGVLAMIAGAATMFYGWTGYQAGFTKDPFYTLLLYAAFGLAGIVAFPATIAVDYYLAKAETSTTPWSLPASSVLTAPARWGTRAVQPVVPGAAPAPEPTTSEPSVHVPYVLQALILVFPIAITLAGIAAFWYFGVTLPGHLGGGPSAAP